MPTPKSLTLAAILAIGGVIVAVGLSYFSRPAIFPDIAQPAEANAHPTDPASQDDLLAALARDYARLSPSQVAEKVESLAKFGAGAIPGIGSEISTAPIPAQGALAEVLARIGSAEAIEKLLIHAVTSKSLDGKRSILSGLQALSNAEGVEALTSALVATTDPVILAEVQSAISRLAEPSTVAFLAQLIRESTAANRSSDPATSTLGTIRSEAAAPALVELAKTAPEDAIIVASARSLAKIGSPDAIVSLVQVLQTRDGLSPATRTGILGAMESIDNPASSATLMALTANDQLPTDIHASAATALHRLNEAEGK